MLTRRECLKWGVGLSVLSAIGAASARGASYRYFDACPELRNLVTEALPPEAAIEAFRVRIVRRYSGPYALIDPIEDASLREYLQGAAGSGDALEHLSATFPARFHKLWDRFDASLPLKGRRTRVYLLPAPEDALGGSVRFDGRDHYVLLGAAVMGLLEKAGVAGDAFIHHELSHLYHQQQNAEIRNAARSYFVGGTDARLYQILWLEGLAVYVSGRLNETATDFDLLRSRQIHGQVATAWPALKTRLRANFDSTERGLITHLVFDGDEAQKLPGKTGYYVGYRLAQELGRTHSLEALARLRGDRLRTALLGALDSAVLT